MLPPAWSSAALPVPASSVKAPLLAVTDRRVIGAGHGDDDVLRREAAVVVVDLDRIGQRDLSPSAR